MMAKQQTAIITYMTKKMDVTKVTDTKTNHTDGSTSTNMGNLANSNYFLHVVVAKSSKFLAALPQLWLLSLTPGVPNSRVLLRERVTPLN